MRTAICLYVRNEERDIAEWVIYHSIIGFDAFIIYDNGSNDRTPQILDRLRRLYNVKIIDWPRGSKYSQLEAYDDCLKNFREDFEWIAFVDSDEFIAPITDGTVSVFLARHVHAEGIILNWSIFGSSGHIAAPAGLIVESFTNRAVEEHGINRNTKMIVRPRSVVAVLDPHSIAVEGRVVHADGSIPERQADGRTITAAGFSVCRVNHYFTRSLEHWGWKMQRGYREGFRPEQVFATHDLNDVADFWAADHAERIREALAAVGRMPLRERTAIGPVATSEAEKQSAAWLAIRPTVGDVLFRAPDYAREPGNTLFDPAFYLGLYTDVRAAGFDAFEHYVQFGAAEGRRPCTREALLDYLRRH